MVGGNCPQSNFMQVRVLSAAPSKRKEDKMPIQKVKGGFRWGNKGKVYKNKAGAVKQARAIIMSQKRAGKKVK